ncbi:MAG: UvrD-helicase domain-containing protein, partial [Candidatus Poribacteria bacterium]|nr:UvrD-helicase domain-containing protein [Candidatus Poribacteria bacterium]
QTTNPDRRRKEHFSHSSNDRLRQSIRSEGKTQFNFEVLERVPGREANRREAHWIAFYRERADVFNRADPLRVQYSNQLILEMFCQHFDIPYKEHLDQDPDFENLRERFNDIKETVMRAKRQVVTGVFDPMTLEDRVAQAFAVQYETLKTEANAVDFEDMIIHAANLLETCPDLQQTYRDKYPYVLVDEFQDISPADFRLILHLSENLFAVGDDDQAIYSFRGGDSRIMQEFTNRRDVTKYEITRNYRSTSTVVEHARALIERNTPRIRKNLRAHNPRQRNIKIVETTPETVETTLLRELDSPQETAILARTNYEMEQIQGILAKRTTCPEVTTIHKAKGREWEKVILVHNTLERRFPRRDSETLEERRVFYVAMTRAKSALVVLGGRCPFVPEFEKIRKNIGYYFRQLGYWWARKRLKDVS